MSRGLAQRAIEISFPAEPRIVHDVRVKFEEFTRPLGFAQDDIDTMKVALSEACANAVCHGSPRGPSNRVHVRIAVEGERLLIQVSDEGRGFQPNRITLPEYEEWKPSGRGLFLMQALMDTVDFTPTKMGTEVRLTKQLPQPVVQGSAEPMREAGSLFSQLQPAGFREKA